MFIAIFLELKSPLKFAKSTSLKLCVPHNNDMTYPCMSFGLMVEGMDYGGSKYMKKSRGEKLLYIELPLKVRKGKPTFHHEI